MSEPTFEQKQDHYHDAVAGDYRGLEASHGHSHICFILLGKSQPNRKCRKPL